MFQVKFPGENDFVEIVDNVEDIYGRTGLTKDNTQYKSTIPAVQELIAQYQDKIDYDKYGFDKWLFELACVDFYTTRYENGDEGIKGFVDSHVNAIKSLVR